MKVYISGPMRGIPYWNFPAFDEAAAFLRAWDWTVVSPAEHDREVNPNCTELPEYQTGAAMADGATFHQLLGWDLMVLADPGPDSIDAVALLPGWELSEGVSHELYVARALNKTVLTLESRGDYFYVSGLDEDAQAEMVRRARLDEANRHLSPTSSADATSVGTFVTKDSGKRVEFESGMRRDTEEGKPRYDLIPLLPLKRLAELYARGAVKYGDFNWQKANSAEELQRFKGSAFRHLVQWLSGEVDEDHAIAVAWNVFAAVWLQDEKGVEG